MAFCCMFMAATTICLPFRILSNISLLSSIWTWQLVGKQTAYCNEIGSPSSILICTPAGITSE